MRVRKAFPGKNFEVCNFLALGLLFLYCWIKLTTGSQNGNIIFWPGAYFLSIWILSHAILYYYKGTSFKDQKQFFISHTTGSMLFGISHLLLAGLLILLLERFFRLPEHYKLSDLGGYMRTSWYFAVDGVIWYWAYLAIITLFHLRLKVLLEKQKNADMKRALITSDLNALRTELNPHFLFNAMNSIAMKVRLGENKLAVSMIASLNDLLRIVLYQKNSKTIPLSEELELLNKYLSIEKIRFGPHVQVDQQFSDDLLSARVPEMILQPLVENAFKHGVSENMEQQHIRISGKQDKDLLVLTVYNTTLNKDWIVSTGQSEGVGLSNMTRRLRGLYGTTFGFQSHYLEGGSLFKITIPLDK